jgi:hypothetical protein
MADDGARGDSHCGITPAFPLAPQANYPDDQSDDPLPDPVTAGTEPYLIVGAMAGRSRALMARRSSMAR